jgi:glycosyltransferase involved in cell wall biosynthesis
VTDGERPEPTVAIHAQLLPRSAGGIETNLLSLLHALSHHDDRSRQVIIGPGGESHWLEPHLGSRQALLPWTPIPFVSKSARRRRLPGPRQVVRSLLRRLSGQHRPAQPDVTGLNARLEEMGVQAVHFPYQRHFATTLPSIFEPWDLQHRHYPEFFSEAEIALRDEIYGTGCRNAALVITATEWSKRDVVRELRLQPQKVAVIRRGAPRGQRRVPPDEASARAADLGLPSRFIFYPAKTWPHKNHIRLFQALAAIRDRSGEVVPLVCTGTPVKGHWPTVQKSIEELSLGRHVRFLGHLDDRELAAVFSLAAFLIFPSLFEGLGIPLLEAMSFELPIVTSRATCLPEIAGPAAVYFDAESVDSITEAILSAWSNPITLEPQRAHAAARVQCFSWRQAAREFHVCYRSVAGYRLTEDESRTMTALIQSSSPSGPSS